MERLTTRDLAARTHLAPQTISNYVKEGIITPIDISPDGRYYFDMSVADDLITRNLLKKYSNHTAIVVLYTDEDSMKTFENTYNNYLVEEGILRIDNLTEKVSEVRERVEANALHDRLFCIYLCEKIMRKHDSEIRKLQADLPVHIMKNPKLEDRNLLLENLDVLVADTASIMEKLSPNDKKIVQSAFYRLKEQEEKVHERYAMNEIGALVKQLNKESGKNLERDGYQLLKTKLLRAGDTLVIEELDRLARKKIDIKRELEEFKEAGVRVKILDIPTTLTEFKEETKWIQEITNILIEVLGGFAEEERRKILKRQREGIDVALEKGVKFGRPQVQVPEDWERVIALVENKEITSVEAMSLLNLKKTTYYKLRKMTSQ